MLFDVDKGAAGLVLLLILLFFFFKKRLLSFSPSPFLAFSVVKNFPASSWRTHLFPYSARFYWIGFFFFLLAFIDPHFLSPLPSSLLSPSQGRPTKGLAIYFVLDRSGSMEESVPFTNAEGETRVVPKIDGLKEVTARFIRDHPSDLIGFVAFARLPQVVVPLTLDQDLLLSDLKNLKGVTKPEEEGSAIGYAIFKTAYLMQATRHFAEELKQEETPPPYTIQSSVMIVVTDGFQNPSRLDQGNRLRTIDLEEAAQVAKEQGVHLYIINVDPRFGSPTYAPHRHQMEKITQMTGGEFYLVHSDQDLSSIYAKINTLEKGKIFHPQMREAYRRFSLYPFLIMLGLGSLSVAFLLDLWLLRVIP